MRLKSRRTAEARDWSSMFQPQLHLTTYRARYPVQLLLCFLFCAHRMTSASNSLAVKKVSNCLNYPLQPDRLCNEGGYISDDIADPGLYKTRRFAESNQFYLVIHLLSTLAFLSTIDTALSITWNLTRIAAKCPPVTLSQSRITEVRTRTTPCSWNLLSSPADRSLG